jgi:hypothetical protein
MGVLGSPSSELLLCPLWCAGLHLLRARISTCADSQYSPAMLIMANGRLIHRHLLVSAPKQASDHATAPKPKVICHPCALEALHRQHE